MTRIILRLAALVLVIATALVVSTAATAAGFTADRSLDRSLPADAKVSVPAGVRAASRASASGRTGASVARGLGRVSADLAPGEHPGFVWCGNDELYVWPGQVATTHDFTLYRTYFIFSATGDFTDAQVIPSDFYFIQVGEDYYIWDIQANEVFHGPTHFGDAWLDYTLIGNTDYVLFYTEIVHNDGGTFSTPEYVQLEALGPGEVGSSNVCRP